MKYLARWTPALLCAPLFMTLITAPAEAAPDVFALGRLHLEGPPVARAITFDDTANIEPRSRGQIAGPGARGYRAPSRQRKVGRTEPASEAEKVGPPLSGQPWISLSMPAAVRRSLRIAYPIALRRLRDNSDCSALFQNLDAMGTEVLSNTLYFPGSASPGDTPCWRAAAWTTVGGRVTFLCKGFSELTAWRAAVILIHEALHAGGMTERPNDLDALTSSQITRLVGKACFLS